jgi:hypothetical protein
MTLELMTELIPGAGPPLTTIPKHLRVSTDVISRTHRRANLYSRHERLALEREEASTFEKTGK